jgi:2-polyprenyl-3-methyl-5-hydroxy-6-metoxy-1,4-benzoquinol methylase
MILDRSMAIADHHRTEVERGERFQFGKNWQQFLRNLTVPRIKQAESSLKEYLQTERLDGKSFLDIGSGSGLFSLVARRLGARVHSFDYDTQSVACTRELRRRFFGEDEPGWIVEQGSVLDKTYLQSLGTFDIVYSWGVLHHTGAMRQALDNVKPLVAMDGQLYIAIYNDLGEVTDQWERVKRRYNALPRPLALLYALHIIGREEYGQIANHYRHGSLGDWLRTWTEYHLVSRRGMSRWHDWVDWVGGYPYERATIEQIIDLYANDGFRLTKLFDCSTGYGCNEFVFRREAPIGTYIETPIPSGRSMARGLGYRVRPPFECINNVCAISLPSSFEMGSATTQVFLIRGDAVIRKLPVLSDHKVSLGPANIDLTELTSTPHYIVACTVRVLERPFVNPRGQMWAKHIPDLAASADREGDDRRSKVFIFEAGRQLDQPHAIHDSIAQTGMGRFSHWGPSIYFSSSDNTDPNVNGRSYELFVAPIGLPKERSLAQSYGHLLVGPFQCQSQGWTASIGDGNKPSTEKELHLFRGDCLISHATVDETGQLVIAPATEDEAKISDSQFRVVECDTLVLASPFVHERGLMWSKSLPELADVSDIVGDNRSRSFVFEDGHQLPDPHAGHDSIADEGNGRFSHWGSSIFLSSSDGSDPNTNGRTYLLLTPRA